MTYLFYRFVHLGMTSNTLRNRDNRGVLKHDSGCWQIFPQNDSPFVFTSLFRIAIVSIMCLVMSLVGCSGEKARELRTLVAPVTSQFPYEFEGEIGANWGGDEYQVHHNGVIHWIRLIGVNGPEPAQPMHTKIRIMMVKKWYRKKATVFVDSIDEAKCEIGRVVVEGTDLSLYLVQQGYGCMTVPIASTARNTKRLKRKPERSESGYGKAKRLWLRWSFVNRNWSPDSNSSERK